MAQDPKDHKGPKPARDDAEKSSSALEHKPKVREIRIDPLKAYDPLQSSIARIQMDMLRSTEPMRKAIESVTRSLDLTKSAIGAGLIPTTDFLKRNSALIASINGSSLRGIIPDSLTRSAISDFKHFFEPINLIPQSTFDSLKIAMEPPPGMSLMSDFVKQATMPPAGLDLFANSMERFLAPSAGLAHMTELAASITNPMADTSIVGDFWKQLNSHIELDWAPVLQMSATTSALTALRDWPTVPVIEPIDDEDDGDAQIITLDDARESVFTSLELSGVRPPHQVQQAFRFLYVLETEIRRFINNVLVKHHGDGWEKRCLAPEMYEAWQERRQIDLKNGGNPDLALIQFADFTDYAKVITKNANWKFFEPFFKEKTHALARFQNLFPYRLHTMHARTFAKEELLIIAGDCQWLLKCLGVSLLDEE